MIYSEDHLAQHHLFRIKNTKLDHIYAVMSIRSFLIALINIFIPIYLYQLTFSIKQIILFELILFLGVAILEYPVLRLIARFGPKHAIAFSLPFLVFYFWGLWTIPQYHWPLWLIAIVGSIATAFFWQAYHYDFSKAKEDKKTSARASVFYTVIVILSALAPLIGGYIADRSGINILFGVTTGLVLITIFPLFVDREPHVRHTVNLRKAFNKNILRQQIAYGGSGVESSASLIIWPLFLFFIVGSYLMVGLVASSALVAAVLATYLIGHISKQRSKSYFISVGATLTAAISFLRVFVYSLGSALLVSIVRGLAHSTYESPFVADYYLHADEAGKPEYIFWLEFGADISRVLYFVILFILSYYLTGTSLLAWGLIIGAAATFLMVLMPKAQHDSNGIN
jgi:MFS family permease